MKADSPTDLPVIPENHLHLLEKYKTHRPTIHLLVDSIIASVAQPELAGNLQEQKRVVRRLSQAYPFVELMYTLDSRGIQMMETAYSPRVSSRRKRYLCQGSDRSDRPYFREACAETGPVTVTEPYLSSATHRLAISAVYRVSQPDGASVYLVINLNLQRLISYLNGEDAHHRVHPLFQAVYALVGGLLLIVAGLLLISATHSLLEVLYKNVHLATQAFGIVILITLAMAIFDLGKTILEEEVLRHKDIHHHDSTRRTITRFMSAIVIAVSIESLLLMFKSLLGESTQLIDAVWMLLAAVALLTGLGVYLRLSKTA